MVKIFDAHMHLPVGYSSLEEKKRALLSEMDKNGVVGGIVISDSFLFSEIGSMEECAFLFADCPGIYVSGGISPFAEYDSQSERLEIYLSRGLLRAVKLYCGHEPFYLCCKRLERVFETALLYNVPVMFHSGWDNGKYSSEKIICQAAREYPEIKFICCHCCYPNVDRCFEETSAYENVYYDISSLAEGNGLYPEISQAVSRAVRAMPHRVLFGSDYGGCDQGRHIGFCKGLDISDNQMELLFYGNAMSVFGITI